MKSQNSFEAIGSRESDLVLTVFFFHSLDHSREEIASDDDVGEGQLFWKFPGFIKADHGLPDQMPRIQFVATARPRWVDKGDRSP